MDEVVDCAPATSPPVREVGVLFVHGIGQPRRGQTLQDSGEALHRWLARWFAGAQRRWTRSAKREEIAGWIERVAETDASPRAALRDTLLNGLVAAFGTRSVGPDEDGAADTKLGQAPAALVVAGRAELGSTVLEPRRGAPPHAVLEMAWLRAGGGVRQASWLLAEARWAEVFAAPRFSDLARWSVEVLLWTVASHFLARIRRAGAAVRRSMNAAARLGSLWALGAACGYFLLSLLLTPFVLVFLGLLLVLAVPPVPAVRAWVARVQQRLASSVGDSYVFLASPMRAAAIVTQVQRDLEWLAARSHDVVVVAHSQGGAVAYLAVRDAAPPNLRQLVTFGSGLRKLEELRPLLEPDSPWQSPGRMMLLGLVAALIGGLFLAAGAQPGFLLGSAVVWGVLALTAGVNLMKHSNVAHEEAMRGAEALGRRGVEWVDVFASADPVPNGPLFDRGTPGDEALTSRTVHNRASLLRDHTTYWRNQDEFVTEVVRAIGRWTPGGLAESLESEGATFEQAARRRRTRVGALAVGRTLAGAALIITAIAGLPLWARLASWASSALRTWLGGFGAVSFVEGVVSGGQARSPRPAGGPTLPVLHLSHDDVSMLGVLGIVVGLWVLLAIAWAVWDAKDTRAFFGRARYRWELSRFLMVLIAAALVPASLGAVLQRLGEPVGGPLVHVPALLMLLSFVAGALLLRDRLKRATSDRPAALIARREVE